MLLEDFEKLNSRRNDVFRRGDHVIKYFVSCEDYNKESLIYDKLFKTSLAPNVIEKHDKCIITEYIAGVSLFDALENSLHNKAEQIRLFDIFFSWYSCFRKKTNYILGDTNFKNFIVKEGILYGLDFETCKKGNPVEDIVWQTAMLATLHPVFSIERKIMARRFLSMAMQNSDCSTENISEKLLQAFEDVCKRRCVELDAVALKEILSSVEIGACLLAGGKSSRMQTDKRLLVYKNKTMIKTVAETLALFSTKYLSLPDAKSNIHVEKFKIIPDQKPNCGPIGGIVSTLMQSSRPWTLFVTSDMPLINKEILDYLVSFRDESTDAVMFSEHGKANIFPLLLRTDKALPIFMQAFESGTFALWRAMENKLRILEIKIEGCPYYKISSLKNINTKEDYEELKNF